MAFLNSEAGCFAILVLEHKNFQAAWNAPLRVIDGR
jgi:hypothetical protein